MMNQESKFVRRKIPENPPLYLSIFVAELTELQPHLLFSSATFIFSWGRVTFSCFHDPIIHHNTIWLKLKLAGN